MTSLLKILSRVCISLILAFTLASCTEQDTSSPSSETNLSATSLTTASDKTIVKVERPNPKAMDAEVATIVSQAWEELDGTLAQQNLSATDQADAYAKYGLVAFGNGLALPAQSAFENAALLSPSNAKWIYFLALLYQYNGNLEIAASSFERALELKPENTPALIRLANVYFERSEMQQAATIYTKILETDSDNASALYGLGRVASAEGDHTSAIKYLERALELQPFANRINYFLGISWRTLGDMEKAKQYLSQHGTNEPHFTDPLFDEISGGESRIDGLWAHMNAGSQAFVDGNYKLAVDEFKLATVDLPNDSRSWQSLGMALNQLSETKAAIKAYSTALTLADNNAVIHHELAKLKLRNDSQKEAEQHLLTAIEVDPRFLDAHKTYSKLLSNAGRSEEALKSINAALALDPQSGELAISKAEALLALGQKESAARHLEKALEVNQRDTNLRVAYGLILADLDHKPDAIKQVNMAIEQAQDNKLEAGAHYALGTIKLKQNEADSAISSFGNALRLNPNHRSAGLELARTFLRVRDFKQSLATYEVHINMWPNDDSTRVEAARIAVHLGDGSKAKKLMEAAANKQSATPRLLGSLARLLVLSTESSVRDVSAAMRYAERALQKSDAVQHHETRALCFAAANDWQKAIEAQQQLLSSGERSSDPRARTRMERNLSRYQSKSLGRLPFDAS